MWVSLFCDCRYKKQNRRHAKDYIAHSGVVRPYQPQAFRRDRMEALDPNYPSTKFFEQAMEHAPSRQHFAILVQLRLGHFPTANYLHRFKKADSPECPECGSRSQTPMHLLMGCDAYVEERAERDRALGAASRSYRALLTPGPATKALMEYLKGIGIIRFKNE